MYTQAPGDKTLGAFFYLKFFYMTKKIQKNIKIAGLFVCFDYNCLVRKKKQQRAHGRKWRTKVSETKIFDAVLYGDKAWIKDLIKEGVDINKQDAYGWTALMRAADDGRTEIVNLLIEIGANLNVKNEFGSTALMRAAKNGHIDVVKSLVKARADGRARDNNGWTAWSHASFHGHKEILRVFLQEGKKE